MAAMIFLSPPVAVPVRIGPMRPAFRALASAKARNAGRIGPILTGTATGGERKIIAAMHGPRGHTSSTYQDGPRTVERDHRGQSGSQSPTYPTGGGHRGGGGGRR